MDQISSDDGWSSYWTVETIRLKTGEAYPSLKLWAICGAFSITNFIIFVLLKPVYF